MAEIEKFGSTKRFGPRYGRTAKRTFAKIEKEQRKLHKCPYCSKVSVKRISAGIWYCRKCKAKFTGKAYTIGEPIKTKEEKTQKKAKKEEES